MPKFLIDHDVLGKVLVTIHPTARKFIARRGDEYLEVTVPKYATQEKIMEVLDQLAPQILDSCKSRNEVRYYESQVIDIAGVIVTITRQNHSPQMVFASQHEPLVATIMVGTDCDLDNSSTIRTISKGLKLIAKRNAAKILLPRARQLAEIHGCHPSGWQISSGSRILGKCSGEGVINLSYMTMFLPAELRDYVICHELAHLSEFNHSPRFHQLCDQYVGGREKQLIAQLKAFHWPLLRK